MRPLALEIAEILGWHDGRNTTLRVEAVDYDLVVKHESVHASLFQNTPDGTLARICLLASERGSLAGSLDELLASYFESCRSAHESAATYIGVQLLRYPEEREEALRSLPAEYLEYYRNYADIIDPICTSSYMRCVFARAISVTIFSSRACWAFIESGFDLSIAIDARFSADDRQDALFVWLRTGGSKHLCDLALDVIRGRPGLSRWAAFEAFPDATFGALDDDEHWKDAPLAVEAERWLIGSLHIELCTNGPLKCLNTASREWLDVTSKLGAYADTLGVTSRVVGEVLDGKPVFGDNSGEAAQSVAEVAGICIETESPGSAEFEVFDPVRQERSISGLAEGQFLFGINISQSGFDRPATVETWSRSGVPDANPRPAFRTFQTGIQGAIMGLLEVMHRRLLDPERQTTFCYVVAPSFMGRHQGHIEPAFNVLHSIDAVPNLEVPERALRALDPPLQMILDEECFWYATRDWANLICEDYREPPRIGWAEVTSREDSGLFLSILQIIGRPGTFIKATPKLRAGVLIEYYESKIASGAWAALNPARDEKLYWRAALALDSCRRHWSLI